jgi:hypothetical protein
MYYVKLKAKTQRIENMIFYVFLGLTQKVITKNKKIKDSTFLGF